MNDFTPSNISYTNKDFQSIYNELLELVPKLTNKWDPNLSNESDPLVVLLKLNALLADKNNYNIDKNILELFPLSVTQRGNAQKVYESLGYSMRWYNSAIVTVNLRWVGEATSTSPLALDLFTEITDDTGNIVYTLIPTEYGQSISVDRSLSSRQDTSFIAMEGSIVDYQVSDTTTITLNNLDANNRLYFNNVNVAENGIFIGNIDDEGKVRDWLQWYLVDNLEATQLSQTCYKFGVLPNSNTCYIEFPQDIANLIGQGLQIKYLLSSGAAGTIKPGTLNSFFADQTDEDGAVINDSIRIWNSESSTAGLDPEDLDEAYENYRKVVTTFNTLVTCKDYQDAIYRLHDDLNQPIVSNAIVTDRTNDYISSSSKIIVDNAGTTTGVVDCTGGIYGKEMSAFDLKLYLLKAVSNIQTGEQYDQTFDVDAPAVNQVLQTAAISNYKSIQHDIDSATNDTNQKKVIYKNKYAIKCRLTTYNKVSDAEASEIQQKVKLALYSKLNARHIEFGEPADYDYIIEVIKGADKAIKNVILDDISYRLVSVDRNDVESAVDTEELNFIRAKNILSGNLQGLTLNTDFDITIDQTAGSIYPNAEAEIRSITTNTACEITEDGYVIKPNETVVCYAPSYIQKITYSTYLYYDFGNNTYSLWKNDNYYLLTDDVKLYETAKKDSSGEVVFSNLKATIKQGSIILPSGLDVDENDYLKQRGDLGAKGTITVCEANTQDIPKINNQIRCYWIVNNPDGTLVSKGDFNSEGKATRFLESGEYFLYTTSQQTELNILGTGTSLKITTTGTPSDITLNTFTSVSDVTDLGVTDVSWVNLPSTISIKAQENELQIFTAGVTLKAAKTVSLEKVNSGTTAVEIDGLEYKGTGKDDDFVELPTHSDTKWKGYSYLIVVGTSGTPFVLEESQELILNTCTESNNATDSLTITADKGPYITFNQPIAIAGTTNANVGVLLPSGKLSYPLKVRQYKRPRITNASVTTSGDRIQIECISGTDLDLTFAPDIGTNYIAGFSWIPTDSSTPLNIKAKNVDLYRYPDITKTISSIPASQTSAVYNTPIYIQMTGTGNQGDNRVITVKPSVSGYLYVTRIYPFEAGNAEAAVQTIISTLDTKNQFDYLYQVPAEDAIDSDNIAESMFNSNNILNKFTIAQIDTDAIDISVLKSSKL